jgi:protein-L-isoaspartate O-methyltransferase
MERLLAIVPFVPLQSVLDIGANTCWAAATFARLGLRTAALDISMVEMQDEPGLSARFIVHCVLTGACSS